jgi:hypothetical protein
LALSWVFELSVMAHYGRMASFNFLTDPWFLIGAAVLVAVLRANRDDLPALIRALIGRGSDDDRGGNQPSLPKLGDDDEPTPPSPPKP